MVYMGILLKFTQNHIPSTSGGLYSFSASQKQPRERDLLRVSSRGRPASQPTSTFFPRASMADAGTPHQPREDWGERVTLGGSGTSGSP